MPRRRYDRRSIGLARWKRRMRRLFTVGSWIAVSMYAIDPEWTLKLGRSVHTVAIWIVSSPGYWRRSDR